MTTDTAPAELVTEEMLDTACAAIADMAGQGMNPQWYRAEVSAALRAVAPMIAKRAAELQGKALSDKMDRFLRDNIDVVPSSIREEKP